MCITFLDNKCVIACNMRLRNMFVESKFEAKCRCHAIAANLQYVLLLQCSAVQYTKVYPRAGQFIVVHLLLLVDTLSPEVLAAALLRYFLWSCTGLRQRHKSKSGGFTRNLSLGEQIYKQLIN